MNEAEGHAQQRLLHAIEAIGLWSDEIHLKRGEYLSTPGKIETRIFQVLSGSLHIFTMEEDETHTIRFAYGNNIFVMLDSYLTGKKGFLYSQALKSTRLRSMRKEDLLTFLHCDDPGDSIERLSTWLNLTETLVYQQMEREIDLLTTAPKERYLRVLNRSPQLFQEIPNKYIAAYLRMTPETLSRLKKS